MTPDELNNIAVELKRLGSELNLTDQQKEGLKTFLTEKYEKLQEYRKENPNISKEDVAQYIAKNRSAGREKLEKFLTPEQLTKWDAEIAKAKDFLRRELHLPSSFWQSCNCEESAVLQIFNGP